MHVKSCHSHLLRQIHHFLQIRRGAHTILFQRGVDARQSAATAENAGAVTKRSMWGLTSAGAGSALYEIDGLENPKP